MILKFQIDYRTEWGQRIFVGGSAKALGSWNSEKAKPLIPAAGERWELEIDIPSNEAQRLEYKYFILDERYGSVEWEYGDNRILSLDPKRFEIVQLRDYWRPNQDFQNNLYTAPFVNAFFNREQRKKAASRYTSTTPYYRFQLRASRVGPQYKVCVAGSHPKLGNWDESKVLVLSDENYPVWSGDVSIKSSELPIEYKYGIYDPVLKKVVTWEEGNNRYLPIDGKEGNKKLTVWTDEYFRYPVGSWKGAGVAIPVFSIRTEAGSGVGEFEDIKLLVDWAKKTGMRLVQVLPVNDTVANKTWTDSYPYAAISVYALHPIYGRLSSIGPLNDKDAQEEFEAQSKSLNALEHVDYEAVMALKSRYYKLAFDEQKEDFLQDEDFKFFFSKNEHWLVPYAAFSYLRDKYNTPDFTKWEGLETVTPEVLTKLTSSKNDHYEHIAVHYFIQYHLDKQLKAASNYARDCGVVLKGDIPIGIYRNSVDAWLYPNLFNMESQAGAPPDDFSISGQNWGFPTYNWQVMSENGFKWWTARLEKMSDYFDVFRIDHILGFFRIWEIPYDAVEGLLGAFNPSLPFARHEIYNWGVNFDYDRMCRPYIREHMLPQIFVEHVDSVKLNFLENPYPGSYQFKGEFDTQRKVKNYFDQLIKNDPEGKEYYDFIRFGLYRLHAEVLFFEAPFSNGEAFNPRVGMHSTFSFQELSDQDKFNLDKMYIHYFYKRHNEFWRERAMEKLPALKAATNMLICGEDLGMVPDCVPGVMDELNILSLAVQRMPNNPETEFGHPADTLYMSVCTTSSHDTSTLRGWWEEDRAAIQRFYNNTLGNWGEAPAFCEPWVASQIVTQHMYSPSMWAIFPIQDLLAMDGQLRREDPHAERINVPANPQHYWKYRLHIPLEQLLEADGFNGLVRQLNDQSGRNISY